MMIIDPRKLSDQLHHFLACEILERTTRRGSHTFDGFDVMADELGIKAERFSLNGWYGVTVQPTSVWGEIHLYADHADWERAAELDLESRRIYVASCLDLAEIAAIATTLDRSLDLKYDAHSAPILYSERLLSGAYSLELAVEAHIRQCRWFGDVPQVGAYWENSLLLVHNGTWADADESN